ncbi:MAG: DUF4153 domain-containing protein [Mobilitalea sp.]
MEQLNIGLPDTQEVNTPVVVVPFERKVESPLLRQIRSKFGLFSIISLLFGGFFALLFYKAYLGLNVLLFTVVIIALLSIIMNRLSLKMKMGTKVYYIGAVLFGISTTLTANEILQFLNIIGILILLDLSLLHQFYEDHRWDFMKHFSRMFGLVFQSIASIGFPFADSVASLKHTKLLKNDRARNIFIGIIISLPILWIILSLLSGADLLFGKMTRGIFDFLFSSDILTVGFMILFGFLVCYSVLCGAATKAGIDENKIRSKADTTIAVTVMSTLCLVYVLFCGIQLIYLFSNGLFVLPEGFTFAEYARRGFFELLAVTIINIVLMLLCSAFFKESKLLRIILTVMTVCTYIMIISATYRMLLYISVYHLTFLRLFVLLCLLIDIFVLAGVITAEYNKKFPLFRYCAVVISLSYLAFSFARPDYFIASYLSEQKEILDAEDIIFFTTELSADAAPVVLPILADNNRWSMGTQKEEANYDRETSEVSYQNNINDYYDKINSSATERDIRDFSYASYIATQYAVENPLNKIDGFK